MKRLLLTLLIAAVQTCAQTRPAYATLSTTTSTVTYTGSGTAGPFSIPFKWWASSELVVVKITIATAAEQTLVLTTDYTVTGAGTASGALTLVSTISSSYQLRITRTLPLTQATSLRSQGTFSPATHEVMFDRLWAAMQQTAAGVSGFSASANVWVTTQTFTPNTADTDAIIAWGADASASGTAGRAVVGYGGDGDSNGANRVGGDGAYFIGGAGGSSKAGGIGAVFVGGNGGSATGRGGPAATFTRGSGGGTSLIDGAIVLVPQSAPTGVASAGALWTTTTGIGAYINSAYRQLQAGSCVLGTSCASIAIAAGAKCTCSDNTSAAACKADHSVGSAVTFTGTGTDTLSYVCF